MRVVYAVFRKDYLVEHKELLIAILTSLILNELILIMVHQADPLFERIAEDAALQATTMKSLVKLLVSKLLDNMSVFIDTIRQVLLLIVFIFSGNHWPSLFGGFLNHWVKAKVTVKVNNHSFFAKLATRSFHIRR